MTQNERFWSKVDKNGRNGCWVWTRSLSFGYGRFNINHLRWVKAHRFAYETLVEPVPEGLCLDHLCRNRRCVNPDHLEPVTMKVNLQRGNNWQRDKTHCKHGHEFTPDNTVWRKGFRKCRECNRITCQRTYAEGKRSNGTRKKAV